MKRQKRLTWKTEDETEDETKDAGKIQKKAPTRGDMRDSYGGVGSGWEMVIPGLPNYELWEKKVRNDSMENIT